MKQNKLTFKSENLVVDYISFNLPGSVSIESIVKYLFEKFNFNITLVTHAEKKENDWFYAHRNQHQVSFRQLKYDPPSKSFWQGTQIHFRGTHADRFYKKFCSLIIIFSIFNMTKAKLGYLGLEPRTIRLKAEYSTIELATLFIVYTMILP